MYVFHLYSDRQQDYLVPKPCWLWLGHYDDVIMSTIASQITSLTIVYSSVYPGADQRKHQSSASLAFVRGIHREPVNSPHKWPVTWKMFPFDDVIMLRSLFHFRWNFGMCASPVTVLPATTLTLSVNGSSKSNGMVTSSDGYIFRVTGPLCGEFTGHRWIPRTEASDAELWIFLWLAPE